LLQETSMEIEKWIEELKQGKGLVESDLKILCDKATEIFFEESTVHPVQSPVIVCGDIHGQLFDLFELFRKGGPLPT